MLKTALFRMAFGIWMFVGLAALSSPANAGAARPGEPGPGCLGQGPLLRKSWERISLAGETVLGPWKLPLSAYQPDILTEARFSVRIAPDPVMGGYRAELLFDFPDPKPLGIP